MLVSRSLQEYIEKHGKQYRPMTCPDYVMRGEVGQCFDVSMLNAAAFQHLRYVEGIAAHPFEENVWIYHAWLTDGKYAFDPTWGMQHKDGGTVRPVLTTYIGIELDMRKVAWFVQATKYKAVMANGWRNREIADRLIPDFPYAISHNFGKMKR